MGIYSIAINSELRNNGLDRQIIEQLTEGQRSPITVYGVTNENSKRFWQRLGVQFRGNELNGVLSPGSSRRNDARGGDVQTANMERGNDTGRENSTGGNSEDSARTVSLKSRNGPTGQEKASEQTSDPLEGDYIPNDSEGADRYIAHPDYKEIKAAEKHILDTLGDSVILNLRGIIKRHGRKVSGLWTSRERRNSALILKGITQRSVI
jgi:hypothetical protein